MLEQGSPEWHLERLGKITASRAADVISTGRRKTADCSCGNQRAKPPKCSKCGAPIVLEPGEAYISYRRELLMERKYRILPEEVETRAMIHGKLFEPDARRAYEFLTDREVAQVGFVTPPNYPNIGCSPDGVIVKGLGLIEIKCPINPRVHMDYMAGKWTDHLPQMLFQVGVTDAQWCDFVSYSDRVEFGPDQIFVRRVMEIEHREEIAHIMSMAKRMDREIEVLLATDQRRGT